MLVRRLVPIAVSMFALGAVSLAPGPAIAQQNAPPPVAGGLPAVEARVRALEEALARLGGLRSYDDLDGSACTSAEGVPSTVALLGQFRTPVCGEVSANGRYIDYGTVVLDTHTNLMWEKKDDSDSVNYVGAVYWWCHAAGDFTGTCANVNVYSWIDEVNGQHFAGFTDWRLPSREELLTIVDMSACAVGHGIPCIDPIFGRTQRNPYWSSTAADDTSAWYVDFSSGGTHSVGKFLTLPVRAVRTRQ